MPHTVFFSWQSDWPNPVGRSLIETCLKRALKQIRSDAVVEEAVRDLAVDRDTLGASGSPGIVDTIFKKITESAVFVSDMTYVARRRNRDGIPNPNVCIEHGWALKALGPHRVISVLNTAMGHPDKHRLPFDIRHVVGPIFYHCPMDADEAARGAARDGLTRALVRRLTDMLNDEAVLAVLKPEAAGEDPRRAAAGEAIQSLAFDLISGGAPELVRAPRLSLRLAPFAANEGRRLEPRKVGEVQLRFPPSVHDRVENDSDMRQWWTCAVPRRDPGPNMRPETVWCLRVVKPGNLEYQGSLGEAPPEGGTLEIDGRHLEARIVLMLEHLMGLARQLGFEGPALASVMLEGTERLALTMARPNGRHIRERDVTFPWLDLPDLAGPVASALQDGLDSIWQASGWRNGSPSFDRGAWDGYADRRNYDPGWD
jgi:hypothetical protein